MKNVSDKSCRENRITHLCSITFLQNRAVCEIMWENIVERDRPHLTVWRMRIACWIPKDTHTHTHTHAHMSYSLLFHCNNGCTNAPECYVTCTYIGCLVVIDVSVQYRHKTIICENYACVCRKLISPVSFSVFFYRSRYVTMLMCLNTTVVFVLC